MPQAAVTSLGLIGAGTNNARIAGMLRNLSSYYYKDVSLLFCVMLLLNSLYFSNMREVKNHLTNIYLLNTIKSILAQTLEKLCNKKVYGK